MSVEDQDLPADYVEHAERFAAMRDEAQNTVAFEDADKRVLVIPSEPGIIPWPPASGDVAVNTGDRGWLCPG